MTNVQSLNSGIVLNTPMSDVDKYKLRRVLQNLAEQEHRFFVRYGYGILDEKRNKMTQTEIRLIENFLGTKE